MTLRLIRPIINRGRYKQADGACYGTVGRKDAAVDIVWALLNSREFIYRH